MMQIAFLLSSWEKQEAGFVASLSERWSNQSDISGECWQRDSCVA